jgi:hypothetical protein
VVLLPDEVALISDLSLKEARTTYGRGWDRTTLAGDRLGASETDFLASLQGECASSSDRSDRPETTTSHSALGQDEDEEDLDTSDDPRSQRGPSEESERSNEPGGAGREPLG